VTRGSKAERIRKILGRGEQIPAIRLSSGYNDPKDAEFAEALTIALLNTILKQAGLDELTNGTRGNHASFLPLARHFKFVNSGKLVIPPDTAESVLLVKGDARSCRRRAPGARRGPAGGTRPVVEPDQDPRLRRPAG
jgi:hypothetical protein